MSWDRAPAEKMQIGGIMQSDGRALIKILSVPDHASVVATLLEAMAGESINIELLAQSFDLDDYGNLALVIDQKDLDRALKILEDIKPTLDAKVISYTPDVAVITVFGHHLREKPHIHGLCGHRLLGHQHLHFQCVLRDQGGGHRHRAPRPFRYLPDPLPGQESSQRLLKITSAVPSRDLWDKGTKRAPSASFPPLCLCASVTLCLPSTPLLPLPPPRRRFRLFHTGHLSVHGPSVFLLRSRAPQQGTRRPTPTGI